MAENKLEVEIGLDLLGLQTGVKKAKKEMISLEKQMEELNEEFKKGVITEEQLAQKTKNLSQKYSKLDKEIRDNTKSIQNLRNKQGNLASTTERSVTPAMQNLTKVTGANATPALQEFSRVIQDAPYGIQGVGNNITQLVSQFGYLSKSTGGAKNAFKAMLGALAGTGGVLFGISTLVSLLTVYGDEIKNFISGTNGATDALSDEAKELEKVTKELTGYYEAIKNAAEGTKEYNGLISSAAAIDSKLDKALSNTNLTEEERQKLIKARLDSLRLEAKAQKVKTKLIDEENEKLYGYIDAMKKQKATSEASLKELKELKKERELTGQEILDYKSLTTAVEQADRIILKHKKSIQSNYEEYGKLVMELNDANKTFDDLANKVKEGTPKWYQNQIAIKKNELALTQAGEKANQLRQEIADLEKALDRLTNRKPVEPLKIKSEGMNLEKTDNEFGMPSGLGLFQNDPIAQLNNQIQLSGKQLGYTIQAVSQNYLDKLAEMEKMQETFNLSVKQMWASGFVNTLTSAFDAVGQALANGESVIGALGKSLLSSLGKMIMNYGTMLLKYAILVKTKGALDEGLKAGGPAAIAAGTAGIAVAIKAIAVGAAISAAAGAIGGGGSSRSPSSQGGSAPQTRRYTSGNSASGGVADRDVVFKIQGTTLVGVLNNTLKKNKSIGGANNLLFN